MTTAAKIITRPPDGSGFGTYQVETPIGYFDVKAYRVSNTPWGTLETRYAIIASAHRLRPPSNSYPLGGEGRYLVSPDGSYAPQKQEWRMTGSRGTYVTGRLASNATRNWLQPHLTAAVEAAIAAVGPMDIELLDATEAVENLRPGLENLQTRFLAAQAQYMAKLDALAEIRLQRGLT